MQNVSRVPLYLFCFFQALYALTASGNAFRVPDEFEVYFQVEHFVDAGDLSVPQTLAIQQPVVVDGRLVGRASIFFGKIGKDGRPYAPYGPLGALLSVPHHLAARATAALLGVERRPLPAGVVWQFLVGGLTSLATSTAAALAVVGFYRGAIALGASAGWSIVLSCLLGGTTVLWPYGTCFYSEAFVAAALAWAAALLLEVRAAPEGGREKVVMSAACLLVAILAKPTAAIFTPAFVIAPLLERTVERTRAMRVAGVLAAAIAVAVGVHLIWNLQRFGHPLDFGYDYAETVRTGSVQLFALAALPRGLFVLLFSPGKSLLLWAPPLVLAFAALARLLLADRSLTMGLLVGLGSALLFFGSYLLPEGGYSHGPRHLVPLVPLLMLPLAHPAVRPPSRLALGACALAGAIVMALAVSVSYLEDQGASNDAAARGHNYYERVEPAPGRPEIRYSMTYVPFIRALSTGQWLSSNQIGRGPDFFPYHLACVRQIAPDGRMIPSWFPWLFPGPWLALLAWSGIRLNHVSTELRRPAAA